MIENFEIFADGKAVADVDYMDDEFTLTIYAHVLNPDYKPQTLTAEAVDAISLGYIIQPPAPLKGCENA